MTTRRIGWTIAAACGVTFLAVTLAWAGIDPTCERKCSSKAISPLRLPAR